MKTFFLSAQGRINRAPFWGGSLLLTGFFLALCLVCTLLGLLWPPSMEADGATSRAAVIGIAIFVLLFGGLFLLVWSGVCLGIKRFHDRDKPGVWVLIQFAPVIGGFWYFFEAGCLEGSVGPNRYGPDPLGRAPLVPAPAPAGPLESLAGPASIAPPRPSGGRPGWVLPLMLVLALPSLGMVVAAGVTAMNALTWLKSATQVEGTVIDLKPVPATTGSSDSGATTSRTPAVRPVYSASTPEGETFQVESSWAESPAPAMGSKVTLAYQPGHPTDAVVVSFPSYYALPLAIGGFGLFFLGGWLFITLLVAVLWKRRKPGSAIPTT